MIICYAVRKQVWCEEKERKMARTSVPPVPTTKPFFAPPWLHDLSLPDRWHQVGRRSNSRVRKGHVATIAFCAPPPPPPPIPLPPALPHTGKHAHLARTAQLLLECLSFRGVYRVSTARVSNYPRCRRSQFVSDALLPKLQALVYDILPSTTAVFSYAIWSRKLSANEQFFIGAQTVVSLLQTTQIISDVCFYNWPCCLRQLK